MQQEKRRQEMRRAPGTRIAACADRPESVRGEAACSPVNRRGTEAGRSQSVRREAACSLENHRGTEADGPGNVWREAACRPGSGRRAAGGVSALARGLADWIWPPRCPVCDDVLLPGEQLCPDCRTRVQPVSEPVCKRCGKPIEYERREYCTDCARGKHVYRQGKAVFVYRDGIRQSMYRFKYANRREYAAFYAGEAARLHGKWIRANRIDVIVPVPMFAGKKRRRGYNQAEVFARALGKKLDLPVDAGIVRRVINTVPQKELNDKERQHNLKNAFQLQTDIVEYRQILLVDDIYTTGSTIDAVSQTLLAGGARNVYYICISIGAGF